MLKINMALSETKVLYLNILLFSIFLMLRGLLFGIPHSQLHTHTYNNYI